MNSAETLDRGMILLDQTGDTVLTWDETNDVDAMTQIEKMMNKGYAFFIIDEGFKKKTGRPKRLRDVDDIPPRMREVLVADDDVAELVKSGKLRTVGVQTPEVVRTSRRTKSPKEASQKATVVTKPIRGG